MKLLGGDADPLMMTEELLYVQGWAKKGSPGLVNFVPAVAYHF